MDAHYNDCSFDVAHNGDDASPDDPRPSPSLSLCTIEHIARNQQSELLPAHASGEARLVVKESPKERTISTYKHIIHPSLDFNPRLSRPSFYPPIDYSLTADQNTRRDFICTFASVHRKLRLQVTKLNINIPSVILSDSNGGQVPPAKAVALG